MAKESLREHLNRKLKEKGTTLKAEKAKAKKYKTIAEAKKGGSLYYTDKNGKVMAAVYATDLKDKDGLKTSLRPKLRPKPKEKPKTKPKTKPTTTTKPKISDDAKGTLENVPLVDVGRGSPHVMSADQYYDNYNKGGKVKKKSAYKAGGMAKKKSTAKMMHGGMAKKKK
jgi:hypothetical protein